MVSLLFDYSAKYPLFLRLRKRTLSENDSQNALCIFIKPADVLLFPFTNVA